VRKSCLHGLISRPLKGEEVTSGDFPMLNRILGSKLLEAAKGSRFGVKFFDARLMLHLRQLRRKIRKRKRKTRKRNLSPPKM